MVRFASSLLFVAALSGSTSDDLDRDGLSDALEQQLLEKFAPKFFLHANDCDVLPAEFLPDSREPKVVSRNGTIYGQVSRSRALLTGAVVEIHYFHLWSRDCGRAGHRLDVEHVSALVRADDPDSPTADWRAIYWYAGAHEGTVCDVSSGSKAVALDAERHGPTVWISKGKHASFLSQSQCAYGCGGDVCRQKDMTVMAPAKLINLGEIDAPLNGAIWARSTRWPLAAKMTADFDELVLARLSNSGERGVIALRTYLRPTQAVFLAGGSTFSAVDLSSRNTGNALAASGKNTDGALTSAGDATANALETSGRNTGHALAQSGAKTGSALDASAKNVGKSLRRTARGVETFLRLGK